MPEKNEDDMTPEEFSAHMKVRSPSLCAVAFIYALTSHYLRPSVRRN
jgi:hypothetical protein